MKLTNGINVLRKLWILLGSGLCTTFFLTALWGLPLGSLVPTGVIRHQYKLSTEEIMVAHSLLNPGPERGAVDAAPRRGQRGGRAEGVPRRLQRITTERVDHLARLVVPHDEPAQGQGRPARTRRRSQRGGLHRSLSTKVMIGYLGGDSIALIFFGPLFGPLIGPF